MITPTEMDIADIKKINKRPVKEEVVKGKHFLFYIQLTFYKLQC